MAPGREIICFQFGSYSNFVGAHFWNQQEANFVYGSSSSRSEVNGNGVEEDQLPDNDVLYREGQTDQHRTTYTPRLLAVDLKGALGHMPIHGELYGTFVQRDNELVDMGACGNALEKTKEAAETNQLSTDGEVEVQARPAARLTDYQRDLSKGTVNTLDKDYELSVNSFSWADFLYARYHPRSVSILPKFVRSLDIQTLAMHAGGAEMWQEPNFNEDFTDRIRQYVEECDGLQGFQMLFDLDDGFSGLATKCLDHLNDEYRRISYALPMHYPRFTNYPQADARTAHSIRVANTVLSYYHLSEQAALFTPICTLDAVWRKTLPTSRQFEGVKWQTDNLYQSSAVLAAYLDTMTLSYRLRHSSETLVRFCDRVGVSGRKFTAAAMALPLGMATNQDFIEFLDQRGSETSLMTPLTPNCEPGNAYVVQSVVARGIPPARLKRPPQTAGNQLRMAAYNCDSVSQMLQLYYQCSHHNSLTHAAASPLPLKTQLPFPYEIFDRSWAQNGYKLPNDGEREKGVRVASVPALAALQNSTQLGKHLDTVHAQTHRVQFEKVQRYGSLERDEYNAALEHLLEFRDNYNESQYL